jgi:signal peptidase I
MGRGWLGRAAAAGIAVFVAVLGWAFLGPAKLGGGASYAVVAGSSMFPTLKAGDLALLRASSDYGIGDVVGYRTPELDRVVVHRITARQGERFTMKGDANSWTDSVHPARSEILGELWVRAPGLGGVVLWLRSPGGLALLGLIIASALVVLWKRPGTDASAPAPASREPASRDVTASPLVTAFAAATICFMLLGVVAFTRPTSGQQTIVVPFTHHGLFSYSASAAPGVYERPGAVTGDPVYLRVAPSMTVNFSYRMDSQASRSVTGTSRLVAEIADPTGWKRTVELQPERPFAGDHAIAAGTIDFRRVWDLIHHVETLTGIPKAEYSLAVIPQIKVHGTVAGQAIGDEFAPSLGFRLNALQVAMQSPAGDSVSVAIAPSKEGSTRDSRVSPRTLNLIGADLSVATARAIAIAGLLLALAATAIAARAGGTRPRRRPVAEPDGIRARYGKLLLPVRSAGTTAFKRVIDIEDIDVLAELAERGGGIIFHEEHAGRHAYIVPEGDIAYRYVVEGNGGGAAENQGADDPRQADRSGTISRPSAR